MLEVLLGQPYGWVALSIACIVAAKLRRALLTAAVLVVVSVFVLAHVGLGLVPSLR